MQVTFPATGRWGGSPDFRPAYGDPPPRSQPPPPAKPPGVRPAAPRPGPSTGLAPLTRKRLPSGPQCKSLGSSHKQPRALRKWLRGVGGAGAHFIGQPPPGLPGGGVGGSADLAPIRGGAGSRPDPAPDAARLPGAGGPPVPRGGRGKQRPKHPQSSEMPLSHEHLVGVGGAVWPELLLSRMGPCPQAEPRPPSIALVGTLMELGKGSPLEAGGGGVKRGTERRDPEKER